VTREPCEDGEECRSGPKRRDGDSTREPRNRDATREPKDVTREPCEEGEDCKSGRKHRDHDSSSEESEAIDTPLLRRTLKRGRPGRRGDGNRARRSRDDDSTKPPRDRDATHEPKDVTREPCEEGEDCKRGRKSRDADSRKPCDDEADTSEESEATEAPLLRRLLKRGRPGRSDDDNDSPRSADRTRSSRDEDATREPKDVTREPCEGEDCQRKHRGRGRGNKGDSDATREPKDATREPCEGDDCQRKQRGRGRKETAVATEEPRRALGRKGRGRKGAIDATISNGLVEIAGVTGEVVFGEVDEELESIPLTLTVGETSFTCDVHLRRSGKVSCRAKSEDNFHVRLGCEVVDETEA